VVLHLHQTDELALASLRGHAMPGLAEMRDAAGDSGEFYTPREVAYLMAEMIAPEPGHTVRCHLHGG